MARFPWGYATIDSSFVLGDSGRHLEIGMPEWQGAKAGQHIDIRINHEDGSKTVRSYSLSSGPNDAAQISVELVEGGVMSTFLVNHVKDGDKVEARGPIGSKFIYDEEKAQRPAILIGGGSGVAPLRGMWRAAKEYGSTVKLVYSVRTPDKAWFMDEIEAEGVDMLLKITRGEHATGRVNKEDLESVIAEFDNPRFYICGPNAFVDFIDETLVELNIEPGDVEKEKWG